MINENDTITIDEIKFGDNDTLGAMAAAMVNADLYIILTDQEGVFTDNPRDNPNARMIRQERAMADYLFDIAGDGGKRTRWDVNQNPCRSFGGYGRLPDRHCQRCD